METATCSESPPWQMHPPPPICPTPVGTLDRLGRQRSMNAKAANKTVERVGENLMCFISTESARPFDTWAIKMHLFIDNLSVVCVEITS